MNHKTLDYFLLHHRPRSLSSRRVAILRALASHIEQEGYSPTIRELATTLNLKSHSSVHAHLDCLQRDGFLTKRRRAARSWDLTMKARQLLGIGQTRAA